MKNLNLSFFIKKDKTNAYGIPRVYVRIRVGKTQSTFTTEFNVEHSRWKTTNQLRNTRKEEDIQLRNSLEKVRTDLKGKLQEISDAGIKVTAENLKNHFLGKSNLPGGKSKTINQAFELHNARFARQVEIGERSEDSLGKFETTFRHLKEFMKTYYLAEDFELKKLDNEFIDEFDLFMRSTKKIGNNSTVKYCQALEKVVRLAIKYHWLKDFPFSLYEGKLKEVDTVYLNDEELERIESKIFDSERLNVVKDLFLFTCYTAYAPCDIAQLTKANIVKHLDGELWLFKKRVKTDIECNVPLLPEALSIIDKYKSHPDCIKKGSLLPIRSNQKVNEYLKEIAVLCGIDKPLHHYVGRHTFATTIMLANGVPIETVAKMMGHKRLTQTQHYAKLINRKVSEDIQRLKEVRKIKARKRKDGDGNGLSEAI